MGIAPIALTSEGLTDLTAVAAVTAKRSGEMKAEDYARALLDRAQHLVSLNAFRTLDPEMVLEAARAADKLRASGAALGALHGLPIPVLPTPARVSIDITAVRGPSQQSLNS